ncbi:dienelactone hydrolase family protein [Roseicella aquatilis]|uniref:Dienelactone hydrolase domain-containing protein n=1 Tax=Roseicella aquatilis TaxID=2527868 RepID=A0A4R4DFA0_9PROT|nr:hypothetical protein [Roseicella aquatilis]TCZ58543.1 hypothetical protein EXY23_16500 [Roseicella aquatilis]
MPHLDCRIARVWRLLAALFLLLPAWASRADEPAPMPEVEVELLRLGEAGTGILSLPPQPAGRRMAVAVVLHDLDGSPIRGGAYADRLLAGGVAVLAADFAGGGAESGPDLPHPAVRLQAVLDAVARHARLDPGRVVLLGLGEGARAALLGGAEAPPVAGLALLYPGCDPLLALAATASRAPRVLLLHGTADAVNPAAACDRLAAAFPPGCRVSQRRLAGATYGWDAYAGVPPGGAIRLAHPAGGPGRAWSRPDVTATLVAADRVLGFVLATTGQ